jgi:hypothetical protein
VDLKEIAKQIRDSENDHIKLLSSVLQADDGALCPADLIVVGVVQRSLMLINGFLSLLRSGNYICAGAILRMQLDNILRLYAASLFPSGRLYMPEVIVGLPHP